MVLSKEMLDLIEEYGYWEEHQDYPVYDWRVQVADNSTRQGYWEWVLTSIESRKEDASYSNVSE